MVISKPQHKCSLNDLRSFLDGKGSIVLRGSTILFNFLCAARLVMYAALPRYLQRSSPPSGKFDKWKEVYGARRQYAQHVLRNLTMAGQPSTRPNRYGVLRGKLNFAETRVGPLL